MHFAALAHGPQLLGRGLVARSHERIYCGIGQIFTDQRHEVIEPLAVTTQRRTHTGFDTIRPLPAFLQARCRVVAQTYAALFISDFSKVINH